MVYNANMEKTEEKPAEAPQQPTEQGPQKPVMDVAPPPANDKPADPAQPAQPAEQPVPAPNDPNLPPDPQEPLPEAPAPQKPAKQKQPGSHVGLAIVATIVIVLGLAALATFAFLQNN